MEVDLPAIRDVILGGKPVRVSTRDVLATAFCIMVEFARADADLSREVPVVTPLSGHLPFLLRDLVIGLIASFLDGFASIIDLDTHFFIENIRSLYQNCDLRAGTLRFNGEWVDLGAFRSIPLLTIEGEWDDIAAPGHPGNRRRGGAGEHVVDATRAFR